MARKKKENDTPVQATAAPIYTPPTAAQLTEREKKEKYIRDTTRDVWSKPGGIAVFVDQILKTLAPIAIPRFHCEIYRLITTVNRLALAAPRSFAKSTLVCVLYPTWLVIFKRQHRDNIAIFSSSQSIALEHLRKVKNIFETHAVTIAIYYVLWGKMPYDKNSVWREDEIEFTNGVKIQARGAGMQTRGKRPNVAICDDLETTEGVRSAEQRKYLDEWFRKDIIGMLTPQGQLILIGTILHYDSLLKTFIDTGEGIGWTVRLYQAYFDGVEEPGHELWPEAWSHAQLQQRKAEQGTAYFACEMMNDPISVSDAIFQQDYIRFWETLPDKYSCVQILDPAYSEINTADFKVSIVVAIDDKNNRYVVDRVRTKLPENDYINACLNQYLKFKNRIMYVGMPGGREIDFYNKVIETAANRKLYIPHREVKNTMRSATGTVERNKKARITMALQALFQQGKYYVHRTHTDVVDELLHHPYSKHDDLIDAMASAEQLLTPVFFDMAEVKDNRYGSGTPQLTSRDMGDTGYGM